MTFHLKKNQSYFDEAKHTVYKEDVQLINCINTVF